MSLFSNSTMDIINKTKEVSHAYGSQKQFFTPKPQQKRLGFSPEVLDATSKTQNNSKILKQKISPYQDVPNLNDIDSAKKILPLVTKDIIYSLIKKYLGRIENRILIKKISFQLLNLKQSKDLNHAFYSIKNYAYSRKLQKFTNKFFSLRSPNLLTKILSKVMRSNLTQGFKGIKEKSNRKKKVFRFIQKFENCVKCYIRNQFGRTFVSKLKQFDCLRKFRQKHLKMLSILTNKYRKRLTSFSFIKIRKFSIFSSYEKTTEQRKQKNKQVFNLSLSRKSCMNQEKQRLKKLKSTFDSINYQKNRSSNELKKSRTIIKQQNFVDYRTLMQEQSQLTQNLEKIKQIYNQLKRELELRQVRKLQAENNNYTSKVMNLYESIEKSEKQQIRIPQHFVINEIMKGEQIRRFQAQSPEFYFHINLDLLQLVYVYEKVKKIQTEEMDPIYFQKSRENRFLKNMLSSLISRQIDKGIHGSIVTFTKQMQIQQMISPIKSCLTDFQSEIDENQATKTSDLNRRYINIQRTRQIQKKSL